MYVNRVVIITSIPTLAQLLHFAFLYLKSYALATANPHLVSLPRMPMIIFIVAIAAVALGGAMYYRTGTEATTTPDATATTEEAPATSGISNMLDAAEGAADAIEQGMGGAGAVVDTPADETPTPTSDSTYEDGTYTKTGAYVSPAGQETVTVSLTLENDIITDATFTGNATNPGSVRNQSKFAEGYSTLVVGKSIDAVALTVVNGSSLTGIGFMDALDAIKDDAKM